MTLVSDQIVKNSPINTKVNSVEKISSPRASEDMVIKVKNLKKKFGDFYAVNDISFDIKRGELFSLLGPNGAGKSTTIRMLTTVLKPSDGQVTINDFDLKKKNLRSP